MTRLERLRRMEQRSVAMLDDFIKLKAAYEDLPGFYGRGLDHWQGLHRDLSHLISYEEQPGPFY